MLRSVTKCKTYKHMREYSKFVCKDNSHDVNNNNNNSNETTIKSYETIPGPKGICGIGTFYHYFSFGM